MAEKIQCLLWHLLNHLPNDSQAAVEDPEGMGIHCLPGFPFCFWICPIWLFYQWPEATLPITLHSCWHYNLIPFDRDRSLSIWNVKMKHCKQPMSYSPRQRLLLSSTLLFAWSFHQPDFLRLKNDSNFGVYYCYVLPEMPMHKHNCWFEMSIVFQVKSETGPIHQRQERLKKVADHSR